MLSMTASQTTNSFNFVTDRRAKRLKFKVKDFCRLGVVSILDHLEMSLYSFDGVTDVDILRNQAKDITNFSLEIFVPKRVKIVKMRYPK